MGATLRNFHSSDFKEIIPEYFNFSLSSIEEGIKQRKLRINKNSFSVVIMLQVEREKWDINKILTTTFDLEFEYIIRHSNRYEWTANKFLGDSSEEEIQDFSNSVRTKIRNDKKDAIILFKKVNNLFWVSIILKNLKKIGIYEKPRYIVLSENGKYFFTKDKRAAQIIRYVTATLGYQKAKKIKLSGKSLPSLMKLLIRKDKAKGEERPVYEGGEAFENEHGFDFTQKNCYYEFFDNCVDDAKDIDLQSYTVVSVKCPWLGDDTPILQDMEFKSAVTFKGNVSRIIRELPVASVVKPPIPNHLRDFSVRGRNVVFLKHNTAEF